MLNIDWSKLTSANYWLEGTNIGETFNVPVIATDSPFFYFFLGLFGGLIIIAILINVYKLYLDSRHPLQSKLSITATNLGWMGFLGLLWFGVRELQASFLSSRIWLLLGLVWLIVLAVYLLHYYLRYYKLEMGYYNSIKNDPKISKKAKKIA
jgi:hypothetical protein